MWGSFSVTLQNRYGIQQIAGEWCPGGGRKKKSRGCQKKAPKLTGLFFLKAVCGDVIDLPFRWVLMASLNELLASLLILTLETQYIHAKRTPAVQPQIQRALVVQLSCPWNSQVYRLLLRRISISLIQLTGERLMIQYLNSGCKKGPEDLPK